MIRWIALLSVSACLGTGAAAGSAGLERMGECGTRCSQGLHCKTKPDSLFPPPCRPAAEGLNTSSVFHTINVSTVMSCEGRQKCSLHLRIKTVLQLHASITGLTVCTATVGMLRSCQIFSFTRSSRERMSRTQVYVENDCTLVSPNQQVQVTVKTLPRFCGLTWTSTYKAPECSSEDLRKHVPECITGRLSYNINPERKELRVNVSEMLEDQDYNLRLCNKDFICYGTGAKALIKKEEPVKSVVLPYSRPLPCLCIEGWSSVVDALRVQVCPFKDRLEELWFGISFDPVEQTLSWELPCPVTTAVTLCQRGEGDECQDLLQASKNVSRGKVAFEKVDPHPHLCMKFTVGSQSWTKCPFADGRFQAWDVILPRQPGHEEVKLVSKVNVTFSVAHCAKSGECQITEANTVHVGKNTAAVLMLPGESCDSCVQVRRLDMKYAAAVLYCLQQCNYTPSVRPVIVGETPWDWTWFVVPTGACLAGIIIVTLVLHFMLTVLQMRKCRRNRNKKHTDLPAHPSLVSVSPTSLVRHHGRIFVPDSLQCGNMERATLISV